MQLAQRVSSKLCWIFPWFRNLPARPFACEQEVTTRTRAPQPTLLELLVADVVGLLFAVVGHQLGTHARPVEQRWLHLCQKV